MILLGTSGFSFPDWDGVFYPPGLERTRQFDYYVRQFGSVEINSTYYRVPPPSTMATLERKSPPGFEFIVKANQEMTHKQSYSPELYEAFHAAMALLARARKLGGVLAQRVVNRDGVEHVAAGAVDVDLEPVGLDRAEVLDEVGGGDTEPAGQ